MAVDKLVDSSQLDSDLTSVANAIRTKGGTSAALAFPAGFVSAIGNIKSKVTVTATVSSSWYVEFSVPNIGNWKAFQMVKDDGDVDTDSGNIYVCGARDTGIAACQYRNNSLAKSQNCWYDSVFIDTEPSAMSVICKVLTRANSLVVFRNGGNVNYVTGKSYTLTLYY